MSRDPERPPPPPEPGDDDEPASDPFGLLPVLVIIILIVGGLLLAFRLRENGRIQDCVWSGRKNCAPIDPSNP